MNVIEESVRSPIQADPSGARSEDSTVRDLMYSNLQRISTALFYRAI